jgi:hypothetical protein
MRSRLVSCFAFCLTAVPAFVVAQQSPAPVAPPKSIVTPPVVPPTPPTPVPPAQGVVAPETPQPEITVNVGGGAPATGGLAPLPKVEFDLPPGLIPAPSPTRTNVSAPPLMPSRPLPSAPPAKLTPAQIAQQIAPNFNVTRDYLRLTQCYGIADFMGAVTRIQASRPGATAQVVNVARSISGLQDAMQPMVLAASTVRGEARFRADYDAVARRGQGELATSRTPNVTMQRRLATLDACRGDVSRWRGGR